MGSTPTSSAFATRKLGFDGHSPPFTMMDDRELVTKNTYNRIAEKWTREHNTPDYWKEELGVFSRLLPKGKILDVGCGPGRHYELFQQGGYDYMGVDYSKGLLAIARAEFPKAKFIEGNILDLPFQENEFDGFWAAASLLHIPKEKIPKALENIQKVVKPGGIGFVSLKKGEGEKVVVDEDDAEDQRFFAYWQKEEFQNVLGKSGFQVVNFFEHHASEKTTWLAFFVRV